jgi:Sulfotransferase domain
VTARASLQIPPAGRETAGLARRLKAPLIRLRADYRELTGSLRGLPSFLIIGAQRSGTTSLFNYLVQHPQVLPPLGKEVHYFDLHYQQGIQWYRGRFPFSYRLRGGTLTLDASPYYLVHPLVPQRVAETLPDIRVIALLRNPVDRALSHYQHELRAGRETLSFPEAIEREAERLAGEEDRLRRDPSYYSYNHHRFSYTWRGVYVEQLRRWEQHVPRSRILVLQSESLFQDPVSATARAQEFVGLAPHRLQRYQPFFQGKYERSMPAELRSRLTAYFEPYNRELYQWLGRKFDWT